MLMGSTSSLTPRFSMQVSPSCSLSSNSNPYCMPEQPPPCTNTRNLRFGLPSPRIRSPTLRAAASVKTRVSVAVSVMRGTLRAGFGGRNLRRGVNWRFRGRGRVSVAVQGNQFSRYDGAGGHFNDAVMNVSVHASLLAENQPFPRDHVAID